MCSVCRKPIWKGRGSFGSICHPRQIAMYLSRALTDKSFPQIANAYKKKDHTTILHAYRKIKKGLEAGDELLKADVERVERQIHENRQSQD